MCDCSIYQCLNLSVQSCAETVALPGVVATETGIWKMQLEFGRIRYTADVAVTMGAPVSIPNRLNEDYTHTLRLYKTDGSLFNDTCYMVKTVPGMLIPGITTPPVSTYHLLTENGYALITEDGNLLILE